MFSAACGMAFVIDSDQNRQDCTRMAKLTHQPVMMPFCA